MCARSNFCNVWTQGAHQFLVTSPSSARTADFELAQRCCAGEPSAQRDLFHREKRRVHATLYRVLGSNSDIDDLIQEAFLEIFRGLAGFRGDASLSTWIDRITVRIAYAYIGRRKVASVPLALVAEVPAGDATAEQRAMSRQAARRLYAVLEGVEARQRIAYLLHVVDSWSIREVAVAMEATEVATRVRVWRARRFVEAASRCDPLLVDFVGGKR